MQVKVIYKTELLITVGRHTILEVSTAHVQQESQAAVGRGLFLGTETTKTKREQPKPRKKMAVQR